MTIKIIFLGIQFLFYLFVGFLCLYVGIQSIPECQKSYGANGYSLKKGIIVKKEIKEAFLSVKRHLLSIQEIETGIILKASLLLDTDIESSNVTFYYSGNPDEEIFLQEESSPLIFGLLFLIIGSIGIVLNSRCLMNIRRIIQSEST